MKEKQIEKEKYAVMRSGKYKKIVKAWQYYSIVEFCGWHGEPRENAEAIAEWCRRTAVDKDVLDKGTYLIRIEEKEVLT